jgi:DNA-binding GntR family transcriptional regulator
LDLLIAEITDGSLKPGSRLVERKLSNQFGVSRTPVREALRKLEQMHIVNFAPYKGAKVRQLQKDEADELFEIRIILESFAANKCAIHATESEIKNIEKTLKDFEHIVSIDKMNKIELNKVFQINNLFHQMIAEGTHNHMLIYMMSYFQTHISLIRHLSLPQRPQKSHEEHTEIFMAIKNRTPEIAAEKAAEHIRQSWEFVQQHY